MILAKSKQGNCTVNDMKYFHPQNLNLIPDQRETMVFCGEEWWHSVTLAYNTTRSFTISLFTMQSWKRSFADLLLRRTLCLRAHGIRKTALSFLIWSLCSVFLHISSPRLPHYPVPYRQIKTAGFVFLCE